MKGRKAKKSKADVIPANEPAQQRIFAIDALRGFDMLFIMGLGAVFYGLAAAWPCAATAWMKAQMGHVPWHGLHVIDCVYPTFLFVAGLSFPFSYAKQAARGDSQLAIHLKMLKRMVALFLLGCLYNVCTVPGPHFEHFRYASVIGRIGVSWFFAALLFVHFRWRVRAIIAALFLIAYYVLVCYVPAPDMPPGTDPLSLEGNFAGYVDRLFMPGMLWEKNAAGVELMEPSGTLENLPSIVTATLGMFAGEFLRNPKFTAAKKALYLAGAAAGLIGFGLFWSLDFPLNKKLWSSSFVLTVGGISTAFLALFYWFIDVLGFVRWSFFFRVIGANSITIYMAQVLISFWAIRDLLFGHLMKQMEGWGDFVGGLGYVLVCWLFLLFLYRRKWFLKV